MRIFLPKFSLKDPKSCQTELSYKLATATHTTYNTRRDEEHKLVSSSSFPGRAVQKHGESRLGKSLLRGSLMNPQRSGQTMG